MYHSNKVSGVSWLTLEGYYNFKKPPAPASVGDLPIAVTPQCGDNSLMSSSYHCWRNSIENFPSQASMGCSHTALKGSSHPQLGSTMVSRNSKLPQPSEVNIQRVFRLAMAPPGSPFIHLLPDVLFCGFPDWLTGDVHRALRLGLFCHAIH